jgi:pimeloyl-ACP methyl ester carboxylesterase
MLRTCALILAALTASTLDWSSPANAAPQASAEQRLNRITVRSVGEGAPVVLIPGLGSSPAVYDDVAAKIGNGHRLILVQVNGFAGSKPGEGPVEGLMPGAVDELAGWLAANKIVKPAIIGHSMGGLMGMMLAKKHPFAAGKLLIVDSLPFFGMLMGPTATPDTVRPIVEQMRAGLVSGTTPPAVPPHMSNNEAGKAKILEWMKASDPKTVGEALVEDATTDFRAELPALAEIPVTVLYAAATPEFKPMADRLYADAYKPLPGVKLIAVENSEHFIMLDQPDRFAVEVASFLRAN